MSQDFAKIRREYDLAVLTEDQLPSSLSPFELLDAWLSDAAKAGVKDPTAMDLSTIDGEGYPSSRIVLLKDIDSGGLRFFTNYLSAKGREIESIAKASANFFWSGLERQVRVQGDISKIAAAESDAYFACRPRDSQIGAWASPQSRVLKDRSELEAAFAKKKLEFSNVPSIPRPDHWGGYVLKPRSFEFWQGRPSRLHDRLKCRLESSHWIWQRLAP